MTDLERQFHDAMKEVYRRAKDECGYPANYLLNMVNELGGLAAAKALLGTHKVSQGFTKLFELKRLDLSVEALVLRSEFSSLFSQTELEVACLRLADLGYQVPDLRPGRVSEPETVPGGRARRGSRLHLQNLVNRHTDWLNCLLLSASPSLQVFAAADPNWVSPLERDGYQEFQDTAFLQQVGRSHLKGQLAAFWPTGGPVWDGLATVPGKNGGQGIILLEAKSHADELRGPGSQASEPSRQRITQSLEAVKEHLGVPKGVDWITSAYYQYANRLAHLYFLQELAQVPTWLVFLYIVNDVEQNGPRAMVEWESTLSEVKSALKLPVRHPLSSRVVSLFAPAISPCHASTKTG